MRDEITHVEAIPIRVEIKTNTDAPINLSNAGKTSEIVFRGYRATIVKVHTSEGVVGIGEVMTRIAPNMYKPLIENALGPVVSGLHPSEISKAWDLMLSMMRQRGHAKGVYMEAISAIEMAMWDAFGKLKGESVSRLMGRRERDEVEAYASSIRFRDEKTMREEANQYKERGYSGVKLKVGQGIDQDLKNIQTIREEIGYEMDLMIDANCGYNVHSAIRFGNKLDKYDITWFEEPVYPENITGYERISNNINVPLAAGECEFGRWGFQNLLDANAVDFIQPNPGRSGGIKECITVADMADARGLSFAPHTGSSSAITMAAELQIAAAVPNFFIYEHMQSDWYDSEPNPLRENLVEEDIENVNDGVISVPDRPGLGITLNEDLLEEHRIDQ